MRLRPELLAALVAGCSPAGGGAPADSGGSPVPDAGGDAGMSDAGAISAPADQWTWVDFPGSRCASGTPTGLAVNPHAGSSELVVYLEGGGSCYDAATCWGPSPKANSLAGYDASTFAAASQTRYAIFDRGQPQNPFAAMSLVFVPYCTGDLHSGTAVAPLPLPDGGALATYFYGATDLDIFLRRLVPTFAGTTHVWLTGTSAGGFGTFLSFDRVARAFGVRVDLLDDSGPPLAAKGKTGNQGLFTVWGSELPAGCSPCASFADVLDYDLSVQQGWSPPGRYGFLTFAEDTTIAPDFGYTLAEYPSVMASFSASLAPDRSAATLIVDGVASHVVESDAALEPVVLSWIGQMVGDDPAWSDQVVDAG
ncbi:MAG: pectin acetylesterase-family hydrolase [Myxococcales bacterium]